MALNKEVWINQIMEGFYPDDSFLQKAKDFSGFVENDRLHIASAGIDPKVLINNTTYPIKTVEREDDDNEIVLDKFETENTLVRRPEAIEYSYDKLESVISQHRATLRKSVAMKAIHAFAPTANTTDTPVIQTSGLATVGGADLPLTDRYIVLHPKHVTDLLLQDTELFKNLTNIKDGKPFQFAGFGFYSFAQMPVYSVKDGALTKVAFNAVKPANAQFASVAFYAGEVMKADGEIYMYSKEDDPGERATIVGFDKRFVALPIRGKGIGAIVSALTE